MNVCGSRAFQVTGKLEMALFWEHSWNGTEASMTGGIEENKFIKRIEYRPYKPL
jgi:hypothetical protein